MSETLTGRVGRLISGGFNALVDAVENSAPELVMEQAIREIDGAIDDVRAELGRVVASKHLSNTRMLEENNKHEELAANVELAVKEGREDLAEAAISKQLDIEAQMPVLETNISELGSKEKELEGFIKALQAKKREMKDELHQYRKSVKEASTVGRSVPVTSGSNNDVGSNVEKAESAFERVLEKATGVNGLRGGTDAQTEAQVAELQELAHKNRIQERLESVKAKMKG